MDVPKNLRLAQIMDETKKAKDLIHLAWREEVVWQAKHRKVVAKEESIMALLNRLENDLARIIDEEDLIDNNPRARKELLGLLRDQILIVKREVETMRSLLNALAQAHNADAAHHQSEDVEFQKLDRALTHIKEMENHLIQLA